MRTRAASAPATPTTCTAAPRRATVTKVIDGLEEIEGDEKAEELRARFEKMLTESNTHKGLSDGAAFLKEQLDLFVTTEAEEA